GTQQLGQPRDIRRESQQRRNPSLTVLVKHPDSNVRVYDGGQYETPCSRISHFGAFSGCRIGPTGQPGVSPLRLRTFWLRLLPLTPSLLPSSLLRLPRLPERVSLLKRTLEPPSPQRAAIASKLQLRPENPPRFISPPTSYGGSIARPTSQYSPQSVAPDRVGCLRS